MKKIKNIIATLLCLSLVAFALCSTASAALKLKPVWKTEKDLTNSYDRVRANIVSADRVFTYGNSTIAGVQYMVVWVQDLNGGEIHTITHITPGATSNSIQGLAVDSTGNCYLAGSGSFPGQSLNMICAKYGPTGVKAWEKIINGATNGVDVGVGVAVDDLGNSYFTGYTYGPNHYDYITIKYNPDGIEVWRKIWDGGDGLRDIPVNILVDGNRNVYVCGSGDHTPYPWYNTDFHIVSYDELGNQRWASKIDISGNNDTLAEADLYNGSIIVAGYSYPPGYPPTPMGIIAKISSATGATYWITPTTGAGEFRWTRIDVDENGAPYVSGYWRADAYSDYQALAGGYYANGSEKFIVKPLTPTRSNFNDVITDQNYISCVGWSARPTTGVDAAIVVLDKDTGDLLDKEITGEGTYNSSDGIAADDAGDIYTGGYTYLIGDPEQYNYTSNKYTLKGAGQPTPPGHNVKVEFDNVAAITFTEVTVGGETTLTLSDTGPTPPAGYTQVGQFYNIVTTATWIPPATLDIRVDPGNLPAGYSIADCVMLNFDDEKQAYVPVEYLIEGDIISGKLYGLTPAIIAIPTDLTAAIGDLVSKVQALNIQVGIENSLDVKLQSAWEALEEAKKNAFINARNKIQAFINECEAQKGKALTEAQANELILWANNLIGAMQ